MAFDAEQLIGLRRVSNVAVSPDGTWVAVAAQRLDRKDAAKFVSDLWRVDFDGSEPLQLTHGEYNDHSPQFAHDGSLRFLSNRPTNLAAEESDRRAQVFAFDPRGGDARCLTDEPLGVSSFDCAARADVMVVQTAWRIGIDHDDQREAAKARSDHGPSELVYDDMPVRFWDHWLPNRASHFVAYRSGERVDLTPDATEDEFDRCEYTLSPNGDQLALTPGYYDPNDRLRSQELRLIATASAAVQTLDRAEQTWFGALAFSPDSTRLAYQRKKRQTEAFGRAQVEILTLATGATAQFGDEVDAWLSPREWADSKTLLTTADWRGQHAIFAIDLDSGETTKISDRGTYLQLAVRPGAEEIVAVQSQVDRPPQPVALPIGGGEARVLADVTGWDAIEVAVEVESVEYPSTDGTPIQSTILKPKGASGPLPTIMWIHGGPVGAWGDVWHWRWCPLVGAEAGYMMVMPNPRGSTGFGQEFVEGIWGNVWGAQCFDDLMVVADRIGERQDSDADRMVAMGGSFGGYMTNWIGTQTDRFKCLVSHAGLVDLAAFHGVTDLPSWWQLMFGVYPYGEQRAEFHRYSPLAHIENWKSPTLVIHGDKDYRVPVGEALTLFEALRAHDVESELLIYPDENHWILKPRNIVSWYTRVFDFIHKHLH